MAGWREAPVCRLAAFQGSAAGTQAATWSEGLSLFKNRKDFQNNGLNTLSSFHCDSKDYLLHKVHSLF